MSAKEIAPAVHEGEYAGFGAPRSVHGIPSETGAVSAEQHIDALRARAPGYAVLVEKPSGKYRRRLYLTLESAQRAKDRATARGQYAAVVLVRLVPVTGGEFL